MKNLLPPPHRTNSYGQSGIDLNTPYLSNNTNSRTFHGDGTVSEFFKFTKEEIKLLTTQLLEYNYKNGLEISKQLILKENLCHYQEVGLRRKVTLFEKFWNCYFFIKVYLPLNVYYHTRIKHVFRKF